MDLIQAIVLGIIQGLTEFLPISSSAHLRIVPALLGWQDPGAAFTAVIQLGTLVAVLIYFRKDLSAALLGWLKSLRGGSLARTEEGRMGWAIFVGTIPVVVCGLALKHQIEGSTFRSLYVVAGAMIGLGILLQLAELTGKRTRPLSSIRIVDGLVVGLWQVLALVPGSSRSGSTITGALFAGFDRPTAARFSFLLSVPSVFAAALYEAYSQRHAILETNLGPTLVATVVSLVVGYWAIAFLIKYLQTHSTLLFVVYRIVLGVLLIVLLGSGVLKPDQGLEVAHVSTSSHVSP